MQRWKICVTEPSIDDLLKDEVMIPVMRSAGISAEELRRHLLETASHLAEREVSGSFSGKPDS